MIFDARVWLVLLAICRLTLACSSDAGLAADAGGAPGGRGGTSGGGGAAGSGGVSGAGGRGGAAPVGSGVLQHHNHATRDGVFVDARLTRVAARTMHLDPTFTPTYAGPVWAQPLYLDGVGGAPDLLFVATSENHVVAIDAADGRIVWDRTLAPQAVRPASVCTPGPVGIIGTPVIDGGARVLYVDALTGGSTNKHLVFALDADTGQTRTGWPVDVDAKARYGDVVFDSSTQNQRGALALVAGTLYIPYGGFGGDCGEYRGWVVGISTTDPTDVTAWATRARGGGIWAPAGISSDGSFLYFSTGNTTAPTAGSWADGEAVFKLPLSLIPTGRTTDYFSPTTWPKLDTDDLDLGGTAPVLMDLPGVTPSRMLVLFGKDRLGYFLDRDNLGGIAAPVFAGPTLLNIVISAHATYRTAIASYVITRGPAASGCMAGINSGHLVSIQMKSTSPPEPFISWCLSPATKGSPIVTMTDAQGTNAVVWSVADDGKLYGYEESGTTVLDGTASAGPDISRFQAPIVAKGRLFVAGNTRLYAFTTN